MISIIIPAFNGAKYIENAVRSALNQDYKDGIKVIVRDDGSTDNTVKVLSNIKDKRLTVVKGKNSGGIAKSFQATFDLADTEFVAVMGQDDLMDKNYITRTMWEMKDGVAMVGCQPRFIDGEGNPYTNASDPRLAIPKAYNMTREEWQKLFHMGNLYFGLNLYRRSAVIEAGGFDEKAGWLLDWDLYARLVKKNDIHVIEEELCSLGLRNDTTSNITLDKIPDQHKYNRYIREKNYPASKTMKVAIATPFYMSQEFSHYGESLIYTCRMLTQAGIEWELIRINGDSYVDRAKNTIIANFLDTDCTDLIMIDSDEQWHPNAISRLLQHPEEIVAAAYPFKNNWGKFAGNPLITTVDGVDQYAGWRELSDGSCLLEAYNISGGFLRIKRDVLTRFADEYPEAVYTDDCAWPGRPGRIYTAYFMCDIVNFQRYGEDAYFGRKMKEMGVKLWIDPNIDIVHYGVKGWEGNLHRHLMKPIEELQQIESDLAAKKMANENSEITA